MVGALIQKLLGCGRQTALMVDLRWTVGRLPPFALPAQNINNVGPPS